MTRPLNYLLMAPHVPADGHGGGVVRYTVELAAALGARDDVRLQILSNRVAGDYFRDVVPRARVHAAQKRTGGAGVIEEHVGPLAPFRRECGPVDVVHGVKHIVPVFTRGARSVLTVHDMLVRDRPTDYAIGKRVMLKAPYGWSLSRADVLLCVSGATRSRLLSYYPETRERAKVVPLAAARLDAPDTSPPAELAGRPFALVVGDALPRKNLGFLGSVWARVVHARPGFPLAVVGLDEATLLQQGEEWAELISSKAAVCLSYTSDAVLASCYAHAEVVLCPSYFEGFGLPAAEAEAYRARTVVSEDPALCAAAPPTALRIPSWDVAAWARAVVDGPDCSTAPTSRPERPLREWSDVAEETVRAIREG